MNELIEFISTFYLIKRFRCNSKADREAPEQCTMGFKASKQSQQDKQSSRNKQQGTTHTTGQHMAAG